MAQAGKLETRDKTFCIAIGGLLIGEHRDALIEGQDLAGGSSALFLGGSGHAGQGADTTSYSPGRRFEFFVEAILLV